VRKAIYKARRMLMRRCSNGSWASIMEISSMSAHMNSSIS